MRFLRFSLLYALVLCSLVAHAQLLPEQGFVSTAHPLASAAGIESLQQGGNAIDAAIAVTTALAVVEPYGSGLGGGGFYLIRLNSQPTPTYLFLDARETAPSAAHRELYVRDGQVLPSLSLDGALAAAIPGIPAALDALNEYAQRPLYENLQPAIQLAEQGFAVDELYLERAGWRLSALQQDAESSAVFLQQGQLPQQGWILTQPDLAGTLKQLAEQGGQSFYHGRLAELMVQAVQQAGGIWSVQDLADYQVQWRMPLQVSLANERQLISAPPPSAGGVTLAQSLLILQQLPWQQAEPVQKTHLIAETLRRAYRDRGLLGDPDFVDNPVDRLLSSEHISALAASIQMHQATPSSELTAAPIIHEGDQTTHFAVIDRQGNAVAATLSLNMMFGAAFTVPGTGILLNDEMDDFAADLTGSNAYGLVASEANQIEANKRPLSSMSPSFIESPNSFAAFGTPGGSRIPSMNLLAILAHLEGKSPAEWVAAPRIHHQYMPDELGFEPGALDVQTQAALRQLGHRVKELTRNYGNQQVLYWDKQSGHSDAASDPRGQGVSLSTE